MHKTRIRYLISGGVLSLALLAEAQTGARPRTAAAAKAIPADVQSELDRLRSADRSSRIQGAYQLGEMGERAAPAIPLLIETLGQREGMVDVAEESLKYFEKDASFMVFGGKAATINPVNMVATVALSKIGKPAIGPLRKALATAEPRELPFAYFADALAGIQDPVVTKELLGMLGSENPYARSRIASALARSKDPASIDALIGALKDPEKDVRETAARSLQKISGQDFGEDAAKWQEWRARPRS